MLIERPDAYTAHFRFIALP